MTPDVDPVQRVCSGCVGEAYLKAELEKKGQKEKCSFCGHEAKTYSIEELADRIASALAGHYTRSPDEPPDDGYGFWRDGWEPDGWQVLFVIEAVAEVDLHVARAVLADLRDRYGDEDFDEEVYYADADADDEQLHSQWLEFEKSIKTENRFFNPRAEEILAGIFKELDAYKAADGRTVIVEAGPGKQISQLFRARTFQSERSLEQALIKPDEEVGPPPSASAVAGRMNAHGVSVFYGVTDPDIAVAEVRPPVGSDVIVGRFELTRSVKLLDVDALRSVLVKGSVFDPNYIQQVKRAKFLQRLSHRISMAVMPNDERVEYLVTQVIADYLDAKATDLDGIMFPSAQMANGKNVMLFHRAARVQQLEVPSGAEVTARTCEWSEDGPEVAYSVLEFIPDAAPKRARASHPNVLVVPTLPLPEVDPRQVTLRLDVDQLYVRHIDGVVFNTTAYKVERRRIKQNTKF